VRTHGCINSAGGLGLDAHACWAFDQEGEFVDAALEFFSDGLRLDQRLIYVSSEPVDAQRERLDQLGDVGGMIDRGALRLVELGTVYRPGERIDVDTQLALYAGAAEAAHADGYAGLRVASQATDFLADPEVWTDRLRWENGADRILAAHGISALCGYRCDAIPPSLLGDLAAVHPTANLDAEAFPFHLFGEGEGLVLSGEIDSFSSEALDRLLDIACRSGERVRLDLGSLDFIDHRGLEVLAAHVHQPPGDGGYRIHNRPAKVGRLCDLLELEL
jgi:anti-anti-sigma regulatory factor